MGRAARAMIPSCYAAFNLLLLGNYSEPRSGIGGHVHAGDAARQHSGQKLDESGNALLDHWHPDTSHRCCGCACDSREMA